MILVPEVVLLCWLKLGETREQCFVHEQAPLGDAKAFSFCHLDVAVLLQCCLTSLCSAMQPGILTVLQPDGYKWCECPAKR